MPHDRFASRFLCCIALVTLISTSFVPVVQAADCISAQIAELSTLNSNITAVCGSDTLSSSTTSTAAYCADSACLAYLTRMISSVPSCEVESYNLRTVLITAIRSCDTTSDAVPASKSSSKSLHHAQQWTKALLAVILGVAIVY